MRLDYWLYMAEAEGHDELVSTHTARLNAIAKEIAYRKMDDDDLNDCFVRHHVTSPTQKDLDYINQKVHELNPRRW